MKEDRNELIIITAGSAYLDIDAYACMVAMAELLGLQGKEALAYSQAPRNYSVCPSLVESGQVLDALPEGMDPEAGVYIIVDVSDPEFLRDAVPLHRVAEIYDHHAGFEDYWKSRIGEGACIEFIGAAATLIYRQWRRAGLEENMSRSTARLLLAAILDNTLNLTSHNTTQEDRTAFHALCQRARVGQDWCAGYFTQVQEQVEGDLKNALLGDIKTMPDTTLLPPKIAQLCIWDGARILERLPEISQWLAPFREGWMINIIDLSQKCSYFVCPHEDYQSRIGGVFNIAFTAGVARLPRLWLRKEIIKKAYFSDNGGNRQ